ncbi:hypothetical protein F4778DRAFT_782386 [Xylariomycetidae sp. FL2044]|nr:hypothetical protein F4778DRAFT_782386 [Xylariomycetidae sp. FL2044]
MLAPAETLPPSATTTLYFDPLFDRPTPSKPNRRAFKKHKVLPHPRNEPSPPRSHSRVLTEPLPVADATVACTLDSPASPDLSTSEAGHSNSTKTLGPDPPPTPPALPRTSSTTHSALPSTPTKIRGSGLSAAANSMRTTIPGTPPPERTPPTPDVTPPQLERRPKAFRPPLADRFPSKVTSDSRTASFKTAREDPISSDEDDRPTPRPSRAYPSTTRRVNETILRKPQNIGLGLGLESDDNLTPRTKQEFFIFDGEWVSSPNSTGEVEQEWDFNLNRHVIVRKRGAKSKMDGRTDEVVEDVIVTPTNATKALRSMPLPERIQTHPAISPLESTNKGPRRTAPSTSGSSSISTDVRRSSGMSSKSTVSTVVEAMLVENPPQRQKTLRHVRKQTALRDISYEVSPPSSTSTSVRVIDSAKRSQPPRREGARSESLASTNTVNSIASRKARREVWKNGGIPVVVIPERRASVKAAATPSLRSTSSHRSWRSNSLSSAPLSSYSKVKDFTPYFDRPSRRGRTMSESDGSLPGDQRTMDYPPVVPMRTSSLSAPTSRNGSRAGSRAGSLTTESLKAHNKLLAQEIKPQPPQVTVEPPRPVEATSNPNPVKEKQLESAHSVESHRDGLPDHKPLVDQNGDPFFGKRLTTHNTPFSQASVETNGTHSAADISEAMAVNIYPHQNKSVLMVHHMSKPVESVNALQRERSAQTEDSVETAKVTGNPEITASGPDGGPVTPPQPQFSMDDVDSPLRNPRAPPVPPAIKFIPATPSGLTPAAEQEKMLGNYFGDIERRPSLVRRAFSLRKNSESSVPRVSGFISRTLSLSRTIRRDAAENPDLETKKGAVLHQYPTADDPPRDESKLHPFWQPASQFDSDGDEDGMYEDDQVYRYPAIDNRPSPPKRRRSLSERMRRTFAILPIDSEEHYTTVDQRSPERRTIKRTPSGNLRVMKYRDSYSSLRWSRSYSRDSSHEGRPSTAPDRPPHRRVWGAEKRVDERGRRLFPSWQDKIEQYRPQNLQRRLSEHRRQKRTDALRQKISGPREVRDGVGEVIKRNSYKGPSYQSGPCNALLPIQSNTTDEVFYPTDDDVMPPPRYRRHEQGTQTFGEEQIVRV